MISIIHPSRSRPKKALETYHKWSDHSRNERYILSLDYDDVCLQEYLTTMPHEFKLWSDVNQQPSQNAYIVVGKNKSAVDAINNGARYASGTFIVVSDDTEPCENWHYEIELISRANSHKPWILKTYDGIQSYIITMPVMNEGGYKKLKELQGGIYHSDFLHLFADTYLTCLVDIYGLKIESSLLFLHNHYSKGGSTPDELHKRNDATWKQGEDLFIKLMKEFTPEERSRIKDPGMRNWLRNKGVV